ncbi:MAG: methylated-DNA--[protein]-cysteine S-methyltransferase [Betaproteobacteria bacterium]|nr:methylated-DNA--[protein]-cysteine S-methyltransferase [Betaproteobacteria bacterium]
MKAAPDKTERDAIVAVCEHIAAHAEHSLTLAALGKLAGLSPFHLQRRFKKIIGVSPREYQEACRLDAFKRHARQRASLAEATYAAGFGSSSRLYEKTAQLGMTPARYRRGGADLEIRFTTFDSPLGQVLVAATDRGLCKISLGTRARALENELRAEFAAAHCLRNARALQTYQKALARYLAGGNPDLALPLDIRATAFQRKVWNILKKIPYGETRSYSEIAVKAGAPSSVRAVARAIATNPVALVVPCHRAVRKNGELAGYRWGVERKRALLAQEAGAPRPQASKKISR